jgi:hypothetical protein
MIADAVQELALPPAHLERLQITVAGAALKAIQRNVSRQSAPLVLIRIFVLRVVLEESAQAVADDELSEQITKSSSPETGQTSAYPVHGWGYFSIERLIDDPKGPDEPPQHAVELYLYHEGGRRDANRTQNPPSE